jgi:hypothetical protein
MGLALALGLVVMLIQVSVASAATRDQIRWSVSCSGFQSEGGGFILDRDNTGQGREAFSITGTDGFGNIIFGPYSESLFIGTEISFLEGKAFAWTAQPAANPLRITVISHSGNGLADQVVYSAQGSCALVETTIAFDSQEAIDGTTSPSTPLNVDPARPTNPDGIGQTQRGFLFSNTTSANLRSGDGLKYTIVGRIRGGTELIVLGVNESRTWWLVQVGEIRGWISNEIVINRGDLRGVPIVLALGEILPPRYYIYARTTTLYTAPSEFSSAACIIPGDLEYEVVGRTFNATWFQLKVNCNGVEVIGWVPAEAGAMRNDGSLPVPITA